MTPALASPAAQVNRMQPIARKLSAVLLIMLGTSLLLLLGTGCFQFYGYRPVTVVAQDAETGAPVVNANVTVNYLNYSWSLNAPTRVSGVTDTSGNIVLRVASFDRQVFRATAPGYLPSPYVDLTGEHRGDKLVNLKLYHLPRAQATLVVPDGFRGLIRVSIQSRALGPPPLAGQRDFNFSVPANGRVTIPANPLLEDSNFASTLSVKYPNGMPILRVDRSTAPETVALYWLNQGLMTHEDGNLKMLLFVGTKAEEQPWHDKIFPAVKDHPDWTGYSHTAFLEVLNEPPP